MIFVMNVKLNFQYNIKCLNLIMPLSGLSKTNCTKILFKCNFLLLIFNNLLIWKITFIEGGPDSGLSKNNYEIVALTVLLLQDAKVADTFIEYT